MYRNLGVHMSKFNLKVLLEAFTTKCLSKLFFWVQLIWQKHSYTLVVGERRYIWYCNDYMLTTFQGIYFVLSSRWKIARSGCRTSWKQTIRWPGLCNPASKTTIHILDRFHKNTSPQKILHSTISRKYKLNPTEMD